MLFSFSATLRLFPKGLFPNGVPLDGCVGGCVCVSDVIGSFLSVNVNVNANVNVIVNVT